MPKTPKVGDTFTHQRTCDPYRPIYYGSASGDFNPIHIDPVAAEKAGLGTVILQGLCTMAWAGEAVTRYLEDPGQLRRLRVRFSKPVTPGDVVTIEGKVVSLDGGRAQIDLSAKNQKGEDVLKGASAEVAGG